MISLLEHTRTFNDSIAIISANKDYRYTDLHERSDQIAAHLLGDSQDLHEEPIAFLIDPSFEYTASQWGIWKAGGIAVPLCVLHPEEAMAHVLDDTDCLRVIASRPHIATLYDLCQRMNITLIDYGSLSAESLQRPLPDINPERRAMILYTSGTTSLPKGVVSSHKNIESQITALIEAWEWSGYDHILNVLPLHHVHGIINVLSCALWSGGCCQFLPRFNAREVWHIFEEGRVNLFMAVPTIYFKLIREWNEADPVTQQSWSQACRSFRLMVSGSAALPVPVLEEWKNISGQVLLERYGMTEIGMGLSNPYNGERRPGHVGQPLPGVQIRLVDEQYHDVQDGQAGEILVRGPGVFKEYWKKEEATKEGFTEDGWFKTGDIAVFQHSYYKILGRNSVDIIKSGGYKISALEIEDILRKHEQIEDCAVIGIEDLEWGEIVSAALVVKRDPVEIEELKTWLSKSLPSYKIPRYYIQIADLPRNTLGKVTKNELKKYFNG